MRNILIRLHLFRLSLDYARLRDRWQATVDTYRIDVFTADARAMEPLHAIERQLIANRQSVRSLRGLMG